MSTGELKQLRRFARFLAELTNFPVAGAPQGMNIYSVIEERLQTIRYFYDAAATPFTEAIRKIEEAEEPYEPPGYRDGESDEPPFFEEWQINRDGLTLLGHSTIAMLQVVLKLYRGHLYLNGFERCLMVLDGKPSIRSMWKALGGSLWMGDISKNAQGVRVQDVKITGIPLENARLAIRMCQIKPRRIMTDAQKAVLDKARSFLPPPAQKQSPGVESLGEA